MEVKNALNRWAGSVLMALLICFVSGFPTLWGFLNLNCALCVLSGLLLGGLRGGLASGIGTCGYSLAMISSFDELLSPIFITSIVFLFLASFFLAFLAGKVAYNRGKDGSNLKANFLGAALGTLAYVAVYFCRDMTVFLFIMDIDIQEAVSTVVMRGLPQYLDTAKAAAVCAVLLAAFLRWLPRRTGMETWG